MLKTGLGAAAGAGVLGAGIAIGDRCGLIPANHRGIFGLSETLTSRSLSLIARMPWATDWAPARPLPATPGTPGFELSPRTVRSAREDGPYKGHAV
jgi:hypothetical protein